MWLRELLTKIAIIGFICTVQINSVPQDFSSATAQSQASACFPTGVDKFAATFYSSLYAKHGKDINFGVELPGPKAAPLVYKVVMEELANRGIPNVEEVAAVSRDGLARLEVFSLPVYYQRSGHAIGTLLSQEGYLNCLNAESLGLKLFEYVDSALQVLDLTNIESYLRARIRGTAEFSDSIGYTDVYRSIKIATILAAELDYY